MIKMRFLLLLLALLHLASSQDTFTIGGFFHDDNYQTEMAFKYAIARHNMFNHDIKFKTNIQKVSKTDSFAVSKLACEMIASEEGLVAIFGPSSPSVNSMVKSVCANSEIPHIQTTYKPNTAYDSQTVINLFPDAELLSMGIATLVRHMNWKTYVILYEKPEGLIRLQEAIKITNVNSAPVTIRQLGDNGDHRPILKEIKKSKEANIILDCDTDKIMDILEQAKEVEMMEFFHSYLITSLDAHTLDYSVLDLKANITTIRILDPEDAVLHNAVRDWEMGELNNNLRTTVDSGEVTAEAALMHDAVNFFTVAFRELHISEPFTAKPINCEENEKWDGGFRLATYMKVKPMLNAITGAIKMDEWGKRIEFTLEIVEIMSNKIDKVATWSPTDPDILVFTRTESQQKQAIVENLQKTTVIVSSRIGPPYLMYRQPRFEGEILEGNARYEGFSMDLIDAIAKEMNFTYRFHLAEDKKYGNYDKEKKAWNGLIKDLLDRRAQLAICDLTITHQRREVVDFSLPFMTLGVSILYSKPKASERNIFAFMEPLDKAVWIYVVSASIAITIIMYLIARMAPGDWENPHPCDQHPEELENIWNLKNCGWLILGSTMSAGCDILPKGVSSRMAISAWWFFILIINSSYTANLAAFLTMDKMAPTVDSAEALAKQTKIKYGTVDGGATQSFFKDSNFSTYARMWTQMESTKPSVFEKNNADGVKRVSTTKNQLYAFLMESSQIEYEIERNCNLKQVGGRLDSKGYGIAMNFNSNYRSEINKAILTMQEDGTLSMLKRRWWKEKHGGGACDATSGPEGNSAELKLANVGGVFLVLGIGVSVAFVFSIIDFLWNIHVISVEQKIGLADALKQEFKFLIKVWITEKRTTPAESEKSSANGDEENSLEKKDSLEYNALHNENGRGSKKSSG